LELGARGYQRLACSTHGGWWVPDDREGRGLGL
jgi:hypothetical protein